MVQEILSNHRFAYSLESADRRSHHVLISFSRLLNRSLDAWWQDTGFPRAG